MLSHCDFVFAAETAKFRMPFIDLAVVPEFGTSYSIPARIGYLRAAELVLLGLPFDAKRAPDLGEHNDEVLQELGFDTKEIERLRASGVIASPTLPKSKPTAVAA